MRHSKEGPLLALVFLGVILATGLLIAGALGNSDAIAGLCQILLGAGLLFTRRAWFEVFWGQGVNRSVPEWWGWTGWLFAVALGIGLTISGAMILFNLPWIRSAE